MKTIFYDEATFNAKGLSEYTGVPYTTLCWRLNHGWSAWEAVKGIRVDESIRAFMEASNIEQYTGVKTKEVHDVYVRWCDKELYAPITDLKTFTKHMCNYGWETRREFGGNVFIPTRRIRG